MCNKAGDSALYPTNAEKRAKIEEIMEELTSINFLFIPLTRIFGRPEAQGDNQKFVDSLHKFASLRMTKVRPFLNYALILSLLFKPGFLLGELSLADLQLVVWTSLVEFGKATLYSIPYNKKFKSIRSTISEWSVLK